MKRWLPWVAGLMAGTVWAEDLDGAMAAAISADKVSRRNITLGAMFQEEFRQQEGVKELKGGLLYKVEQSGTGRMPKLSDKVRVLYEGRRVDGQIFDQTKEQEPREFRLNREMIPGWQEVLPLMREGDRWEVVIPSHLAYSARGNPVGKISPNETLVFKIELVQVIDPGEKKAPRASP